MAVNIDTVYQKVLSLANKEQRGYITPQDFNLFANQAQLEIFEQYFYDLNQARKVQGNDTIIADIDEILEDKIRMFEVTALAADVASLPDGPSGGVVLWDSVYRLLYVGTKFGECEVLGYRDFKNRKKSPLTKPSKTRPIANVQGNVLKVNGGSLIDGRPIEITYLRQPQKANWTYVVINTEAMYNSISTTGHFELHASEEIQLVNKILKLAGIAIQREDIVKAGGTMEGAITQQQSKI